MIGSFKGKSPEIDESCFIAENSTIVGDVKIGEKTSVWYGAVIRADMAPVIIGKNSNVQDNCVIHVGTKPTKIGDGVTIGHGAIVHSAEIGDNVLVGMGSVVLDGAVVGKNSIIGAGAVVTGGTVIPENSLVVGVPGKVVKETGLKEAAANKANAVVYTTIANTYKKEQEKGE